MENLGIFETLITQQHDPMCDCNNFRFVVILYNYHWQLIVTFASINFLKRTEKGMSNPSRYINECFLPSH